MRNKSNYLLMLVLTTGLLLLVPASVAFSQSTARPTSTPLPSATIVPTSTPSDTIEPDPTILPEDTPLASDEPDGTPTPVPAGQYAIHVISERINISRIQINASIKYSGDYSADYTKTPFEIGPYSQPFTVTLTAPSYCFYMARLQIFTGWQVDGVSKNGSTISVTVDDTDNEKTVSALHYDDLAAMSPTPTPASSADPTANP